MKKKLGFPEELWLEVKTIKDEHMTVFCCGKVMCWSIDPIHKPKKFVKYILAKKVPRG